MTKSIGIDSAPPPLPSENEALDVYAKYAADLDSFEAAFHDTIMSIFVKKQGHLAYLKGKALLLAKASSKVDVGWDDIFAAFGVKRSTGFVHIDIAESFSEEETKDKGVNELREEARKKRTEGDGGACENSDDPPASGDEDGLAREYSIKKARGDLKEAKKRLTKFAEEIATTSDAKNNPQSTQLDLSALESDFDELNKLLLKADASRCQALKDLTTDINNLVAKGAEMRLTTDVDEEAA